MRLTVHTCGIACSPKVLEYQRILSVAIDIPQSPIAQHQVHDQNQDDGTKTHNQRFISVSEAFLEPIPQPQFVEKGLKYDRA